jgi:hypothetical protein
MLRKHQVTFWLWHHNIFQQLQSLYCIFSENLPILTNLNREELKWLLALMLLAVLFTTTIAKVIGTAKIP